MATIDRVCPLTSFRVTTDSSGDIKRQFKNDWTMTHDTCAIDVDLSFFSRERERERSTTEGTKRRRRICTGLVDILEGFASHSRSQPGSGR